MLGRVGAIALQAYRESVRARILYGLAVLAFATALYSIAVGEFALRNSSRVVADLGAASISLYAIIVTVVMSGSSLYRELEQKTIFPILARPIRRAEFLVGKFAGAILTMAVFIGGDAAVVLLILSRHGGRPLYQPTLLAFALMTGLLLLAWRVPRLRLLAPILGVFIALVAGYFLSAGVPDDRRVVCGASALALLEVMIVTGIALVFSSFSSPFLSAVFTLGVFLVGREADTLAHLPAKLFGESLKSAGALLSKVVPNLQVYVPPRPVLTGEAAAGPLAVYLSLAGAQALAWSVALLVLASWIFQKRDIL